MIVATLSYLGVIQQGLVDFNGNSTIQHSICPLTPVINAKLTRDIRGWRCH
jgi:hypothetical protein